MRCLLAQRYFAVLICTAALLLKLLVPTGYMIASDHGRISMTVCSGVAPTTMAMDMPGMSHSMPDHGKSKDHGKGEMPCAFSSLSTQALGAIEPILVLLSLAFVAAIALRVAISGTFEAPPFLRPPLRGPPLFR